MLLFVFALFIGLFYEIECRPTESIDTEMIFARCGDKQTLQCLTEVRSKIHFIFYFKFLFLEDDHLYSNILKYPVRGTSLNV